MINNFMNYEKHYRLLVLKALNRNLDSYTETHHIIPKCLGGSNEKDNLVNLTPEEHYLAHLLLVKIYPNNQKLIFAVHRMCSGKYRNNKLYGWIRRKVSIEIGNLHRGKVDSDETRLKKSLARRGKKLSPDVIENMRLAQQNRSDEVRKNMSNSKLGHIVSDETKEKLSILNKGKKLSEETKIKISKSHLGKNNHFFGKTHTEETKIKMKETRSKQVISEESNIKRSIKMKEYWVIKKSLEKSYDM